MFLALLTVASLWPATARGLKSVEDARLLDRLVRENAARQATRQSLGRLRPSFRIPRSFISPGATTPRPAGPEIGGLRDPGPEAGALDEHTLEVLLRQVRGRKARARRRARNRSREADAPVVQLLRALRLNKKALKTLDPETLGVIEELEIEEGLRPARSGEQAPVTKREPEELPDPRQALQDINLDELEPYGWRFFQQKPGMFLSSGSLPVGPGYVLGPEDAFVLHVWSKVIDEVMPLEVSRGGTVQVPNLGEIVVGGLRHVQAEALLKERLAKIYRDFSMTLTMTRLRAIQVYIVGAVARPGLHTVPSFSTAINALLVSGGPNRVGSYRSIVHRAADGKERKIDVYRFLMEGRRDQDVRLQTGDVLYVPVRKLQVAVAGHVRRPAWYEFTRAPTIEEALRIAGGLRTGAYARLVRLERAEEGHRIIRDILRSAAQETTLQDGDVIKVFPLPQQPRNRVVLEGNVERPGPYEFFPGMTAADLLRLGGRILEDSDLAHGEIHRIDREPRPFPGSRLPGLLLTQERVFPVDLAAVLAGERDANVPLHVQDRMVVRRLAEVRPPLEVTVEGEVARPGIYPLIRGMRVRDLLLLAGDVNLPTVHLARAELYRLDSQPTEHKFAQDSETTHTRRRLIPLDLRRVLADDRPEGKASVRSGRATPGTLEAGKSQGNVLLAPYDVLKVLRRDALRGVPTVQISGAVGKLDPREDKTQVLADMDQMPAWVFSGQAERGDATQWSRHRTVGRSLVAFGPNSSHRQRLQARSGRAPGAPPPTTPGAQGEKGSPADDQFLTFELASGMRLRDLVYLAGDLKPVAYLDQADIIRRVYDGKDPQRRYVLETHAVDLGKAMQGDPKHNLLLENYDSVIIKRNAEFMVRVAITGEVRFPGHYVLQKGARLTDLITRTGGFTSDAFLRGARFTRERARKAQKRAIERFILSQKEKLVSLEEMAIGTAGATSHDLARARESIETRKALLKELETSGVAGRVAIRLSAEATFRGSLYDLLLEDGDALFIPSPPATVSIIGEVFSTGTVVYMPGAHVDDYVKKAGGYKETADRGRIFIVSADGTASPISARHAARFHWDPATRSWKRGSGRARVENGDVVFVPPRIRIVSGYDVSKDAVELIFKLALTAGVVAGL